MGRLILLLKMMVQTISMEVSEDGMTMSGIPVSLKKQSDYLKSLSLHLVKTIQSSRASLSQGQVLTWKKDSQVL